MSRKEALTYEERISRLEMLVDQLGQSVLKVTGATSGVVNFPVGTFRSCDGGLMLQDRNSEKVMLLTSDFAGYLPGSAVSAFDEDTGARVGTMGFKSDGTFVVQVCNSAGEHYVLQIASDSVSMPPVRETTISSYDSVVVDSSGTVGIPSSDKSRKRQIEPIQGALEQVMKVQPVRFRWRDTGKPAVGFLNEDLKEVCGLRVQEVISMIAILWQAVRELAKEVR